MEKMSKSLDYRNIPNKLKPGETLPGSGKKFITEIEQLNVAQKRLAEMLANIRYAKYTNGQFAKELGVTERTIGKWKLLSPIQELALRIYRKKRMIPHAIPILEAVAERAKGTGGSADAKLFLDHLSRMLGDEDGNDKRSGITFNVDKMILVLRENENK